MKLLFLVGPQWLPEASLLRWLHTDKSHQLQKSGIAYWQPKSEPGPTFLTEAKEARGLYNHFHKENMQKVSKAIQTVGSEKKKRTKAANVSANNSLSRQIEPSNSYSWPPIGTRLAVLVGDELWPLVPVGPKVVGPQGAPNFHVTISLVLSLVSMSVDLLGSPTTSFSEPIFAPQDKCEPPYGLCSVGAICFVYYFQIQCLLHLNVFSCSTIVWIWFLICLKLHVQGNPFLGACLVLPLL